MFFRLKYCLSSHDSELVYLQCAWVKVELVCFINTRSLNMECKRPPGTEECKEYTVFHLCVNDLPGGVIITVCLFIYLFICSCCCLTCKFISCPVRKSEAFLNSMLEYFIRKEELLQRVGNCISFSLSRSERKHGGRTVSLQDKKKNEKTP